MAKSANTAYFYLGEDQNAQENVDINPEDNANILSMLTFWWMWPLIKLGNQRDLNSEDLPQLPMEYQTKNTADKFWSNWVNERANQRENLVIALAKTYGRQYAIAGILKLGHDTLQFVQPVLLKMLIEFITSQGSDNEAERKPYSHGVYISIVVLVSSVVQTLFMNQYFGKALNASLGVRTGLSTAIYKKSMVISSSNNSKFSTGDIVNRMVIDTSRVSTFCQHGHILWSAPFQTVIAMYMLYDIIGWTSLFGVLVIITSLPTNFWIREKLRKIQLTKMKNRDIRIALLSEALEGIKILKLYAWENEFMNRIRKVRDNAELTVIKKLGLQFSYSALLSNISPFLVSLTTFAAYTLFDGVSRGPLNAKLIFVSLSLFNVLRFPFNSLPGMIAALAEAGVGIERIKSFLICDEISKRGITRLEYSRNKHGDTKTKLVETDNVDVFWDKDGVQPTLSQITLAVENDELLAVVGQVASGKSSLISAILGEMYVKTGSITTRGSMAYAAQQPWIMNATIRENILFGYKYDKQFYERTIRACALEVDLKMMPSGDLTEIGERGINLSGGQKARVSLARAVYSRADIYMFDDPLAAVDAHVGEHIFEHVIGPNGMLNTRCRILVTNAIPYLSQCDSVALLKGGKLVEIGKFEELNSRKDGQMNALVREFGNVSAVHSEEGKSKGDVTGVSEPLVINDGMQQQDQQNGLQQQELIGNITQGKHNQTLLPENDAQPPTYSADPEIACSSSRRSSASTLPRASIEPYKNRMVNKSYTKDIVDDTEVGRLIAAEKSESGRVKMRIYKEYLKSCGIWSVLIFLGSILLNTSALVGSNYWLKLWSDDSNDGNENNKYYLVGYTLFGIIIGLFVMLRTYVLWAGCATNGARVSHEKMLVSVFSSPMSFFDTTPVGRILNRFSKDQSTIDDELPGSIMEWLQLLLQVTLSVMAIAFALPIFLVVVFPLIFVYGALQRIFLQVSRDLKRLDSVSRSPIYQQFQASVDGIHTIRAFGNVKMFIDENAEKIDTNQKAMYSNFGLGRWMGVRLELLSAAVLFFISISSVTFLINKPEFAKSSASTFGLCMTYALSFTRTINRYIRNYCDVETHIVSVERIDEYSNLPSEAPFTIKDAQLDPSWPSDGKIEFVNYSVKYRPELPNCVLRDINVNINPREKVGIVGRTGAGKTSLTLGLFRIIEPYEGHIFIDGIDITKIGLHDLRSRISIIPQDPVLFSGTVRFNLDPTSCTEDTEGGEDTSRNALRKSDEELWRVLELTHLKPYIQQLDGQLDATVYQGGTNFSVGQRQLMCLARALVKDCKIIVMDEATAAIDPETDNLIQGLIRSEFKDNTIITIAHRINTIADSDKVLVFDSGRLVSVEDGNQFARMPNIRFD